nr:MAG TPA: hypothetical protein [Caudoviricetes sp.]
MSVYHSCRARAKYLHLFPVRVTMAILRLEGS